MDKKFFLVMRNNLKCCMCKEKGCIVKYYPERKKVVFDHGSKYVFECKKIKNERLDSLLKR